ncbi:GNAT family N-acetyltransferase [Frankia sp. AgB32]|uniref:GNAT family N-acetyltransferase n=1 Tax=Frankia sp. AgB32 TaxID=631119 RepID=UPI00200D4B7A|nr:GNAT family N-acetyltransferase [Frankia sp. AgB32]MCK9894408.1 N-acetyltransferase family protein [Frankia sp. AgB32]
MVIIRAAGAADAAGIQAVYAPYVTGSPATFEEAVPGLAELRARMAAAPRKPWLVAEADGEIVGYAYASAHHARASYRWSADTSIYLAAAVHRRGLGRALYDRLLAEVRALGYLNVYAGITLPNAASVTLHTAVGFEPTGVYRNVGYRLGAWRDVAYFGMALASPLPPAPAEPRPWRPGTDLPAGDAHGPDGGGGATRDGGDT